MEIGFQIGKELGELRSRVELLESSLKHRDCNCHEKTRKHRALSPSEMTKLQRDALEILNDMQPDITAAVNKFINSGLKGKGHRMAFQVVGLKLQDVSNRSVERQAGGCPWICCDGEYYCCPAATCCEERTSSGPID
ncbi:MAG TPA: hypothetical protein VKV95_08890 [Terriglobia bacterium]|nr:hypothetical protein [Terriglobia bacterium]